MSLLHLQSHNAMSFNLEHINILFHASSDCSSGLLCPFICFCFRPRNILIQNRQFYFDSYLYVKCERGVRLVIAPVLCFLLKQAFLSRNSPRHPLGGLAVVLHNTFSARYSWEMEKESGKPFLVADSLWDDSFSLVFDVISIF